MKQHRRIFLKSIISLPFTFGYLGFDDLILKNKPSVTFILRRNICLFAPEVPTQVEGTSNQGRILSVGKSIRTDRTWILQDWWIEPLSPELYREVPGFGIAIGGWSIKELHQIADQHGQAWVYS